jgi:hypothetical protein
VGQKEHSPGSRQPEEAINQERCYDSFSGAGRKMQQQLSFAGGLPLQDRINRLLLVWSGNEHLAPPDPKILPYSYPPTNTKSNSGIFYEIFCIIIHPKTFQFFTASCILPFPLKT